MKTSWKYATLCIRFILFSCLILGACAGTRSFHPETERLELNIKSILILPFVDVSKLYDSDIHVRCYLCGQVMTTGYVPDSAATFMTTELISLMEKDQPYQIISSEGSQDILSGMASDSDNAAASRLNLYINAGKRAGADAVLIGHIFRFVDRKGNRASVISAASVAFDIHLIDVASGKIVWTANFDKTQQPLSDNLLELGNFIKRGASWVTAEQLAQGGLEDMMRRFPQP